MFAKIMSTGLLTLGCAAASFSLLAEQPGKVNSEKANGATNNDGTAITITPFSSIEGQFSGDAAKDYFSNAYTRLLVTSPLQSPNAGDDNVLPYEKRWWPTRLLFGRTTSTSLAIKVSAGDFTATVPVATFDHISTAGDGEGFSRIVYHRAENYPLFLIKRDGTSDVVSVRASVRISDQLQSGAAGIALSVTQNAIKFVSPQSAVLTTLTKQNAKDVATALDTAINKLFATSVDEEQWVDGNILNWNKGLIVKFSIPDPESQLASKRVLGAWSVQFESPRPSIFSDEMICEPYGGTSNTHRCKATFEDAAKIVEAEVTASDLLEFHLTEGTGDLGTIDAYTKKQDWYLAGLKAFSGTPTATDVFEFCVAAKKAMAALSLNTVDQALVTHALITTMSMKDDGKALTEKETQCKCQYNQCSS